MEEEKETLEKLCVCNSNSVVRDRSLCLLLSDKNHNIKQIASITNLCRQTISALLTAWESADSDHKISVLGIGSGRGRKAKLQPVAELLPALVEKHNRNIKPILEIIEKEHNIKVGKSTLRNFLKGAGL